MANGSQMLICKGMVHPCAGARGEGLDLIFDAFWFQNHIPKHNFCSEAVLAEIPPKIVQKAAETLPRTLAQRFQNDTLSCKPRKSKIMQPSYVFAHF